MNLSRLFENHLDGREITGTRLANFAQDCLNRFKALNTGGGAAMAMKVKMAASLTNTNTADGDYNDIINELQAALDNFRTDLNKVDTAFNKRKGKTMTLDQFMEDFKQQMKNLETGINFKLGGRHTEAYLEFYPHGVSEYTTAVKKDMAELVMRLKTAAEANATALGTDITTTLTDFATNWNALRNAQEQQKGKLDDSRDSRTDSRGMLELVLYRTIHTVALAFPYDVPTCMRFFDFNLLHGVVHHHEEEEAETPVSN